ncbi:MAG TPA: site-2 protease family protein [Gemmatimonadales bacterium]|jgi:stage IV sporulation protein FB|nr:site-2 protease family protein [Gemmatimonadales bacterium]
MAWSFPIARIGGTVVKVHVTFLLLLGFFLVAGGLAAVGLILAVFACVLLHEFGHVLMARRFGVRTPDVILLPIGGLARLERMPEEPRQELLIALAGPVVTLLLAVIFYALLRVAGTVPPLLPSLEVQAGSVLGELYSINVLLLLFNLIPAFPMDGGRVLRALLAARQGLPRATRIAATVGQVLAFGLGFAALMSGNILLLLIAFFVFIGAGGEAAAVETREAGRGLTVREMMVTDFRTLPAWATLRDAAELLVASDQREFPVVDNAGAVVGILSRDDLVKGLSQRGPDALAREALAGPSAPIAATVAFEPALAALQASGRSALPVMENGRLIGMLTRDNITDLVLVRRAVARP